MSVPVQGASKKQIRSAISSGDPLPGTRGFAGTIDGVLVRDVLGRYPLYHDGFGKGSADPTGFESPEPVPAGHIIDGVNTKRIWTLPEYDPITTPISSVREALKAAIANVDKDGLAIAFSGGVDSAILAALIEAPLYVIGFPDSHDVEAAQSAARHLGRELTIVTLDQGALERTVSQVAKASGRHNAMDVSIATPLLKAAEAAASDGFERLAVGQGADELFGGYAKVANAPTDPRVAANTCRAARREMVATLPDQLPRDVLTIRAGGLEPVAPFLDDRIVKTALQLPESALISNTGERKQLLRLAARKWLPDTLAFRKKKAMQYGSDVSRELDRLARQEGFKRRQKDHVGSYVASLLR